MIQMSYCKHNFYHLSMTIVYHRMILTTTELTTVVCALQNLLTYLFPILRVSSLVFWFDWHLSISLNPKLKFGHRWPLLFAFPLWFVMPPPFALREVTRTTGPRDMRQTRATIDALWAVAFVVVVIDATDALGFIICCYIHVSSPYNFARIQEQIAHSSPSTSFQSLIVILLPPLIATDPTERCRIVAAVRSVYLIKHCLKGEDFLFGEWAVFMNLHCFISLDFALKL